MKQQAFVPLITHPDANSDATVTNALAAARWINADLTAMALNAHIPQPSNPLSRALLDVPEMIREAEARSHKRGVHLLEAFREQADSVGVKVKASEIATLLALLGETAAIQARYFDISLIGWETGNSTSRMTAEAVLFGSGRPVILLPEMASTAILDHVAIAWDGSRVAARAVADARPLLQRASRITVLTIDDEKPIKEKDTGERLAAGLRERGLLAESASTKAQDCPIAATLQESALESNCDILVMGAYGHSRVRDFVLGGATEGVLSDLRLPILLSH